MPRVAASTEAFKWFDDATLTCAVSHRPVRLDRLVARGIPGEYPPLADHFVIIPLAFVTGVLPLPVNGLGAFEAVVKLLYERVPVDVHVAEGHGFVVSLGYRAVTILIALIGACYYIASRKEVATVMAEAEREIDEGDGEPLPDANLCSGQLGASNC